MTIPKEIVEAIRQVRAKKIDLKKDAVNPHGGYNYVSIDTYYAQIAAAATEVGLIWRVKELASEHIVQRVRDGERIGVKTTFGFDLLLGEHMAENYMTVTVVERLEGPQTTGKLYSYADKVFMRVVFAVPTGERHEDGDHSPASDFQPLRDYGRSYSDVSNPGTGEFEPVSVAGMPTGAPMKPAPRIMVDDPIADLGSEEDRKRLAPTQTKYAAPIISTRATETSRDAEIIHGIFKEWMSEIKDRRTLSDFHAENIAAIEKVKTIDPVRFDAIKKLFNDRNQELSKVQ